MDVDYQREASCRNQDEPTSYHATLPYLYPNAEASLVYPGIGHGNSCQNTQFPWRALPLSQVT
jgi:hypothetical protein